jgi:hypothetical protein
MPTRRKTRTRRSASRTRSLRRDLSPSRSLGQQLLDTVENIIELMEHTQDPDRLKELNKQRIALLDEARRLIDVSLDTASADYRAATSALEQASDMLREAIKGLESVKSAILKAAKALELVAKVAAMV